MRSVQPREVLTFEDVQKLLKARYAAPQWAYLSQVGDQTGAYTSRHADGVAMGLWPSRGLELIGFEIKVSRSDWRRELAKPDKAEPVASRCDRWFIVAPADIVPVLEIPPNWGLIEVRKGKLIQTKEAVKLDPKPLDRGFLAAILRRASIEDPTREMELRLRREIRDELMKTEVPSRVDIATASLSGELERLRERVAKFEETTGLVLEDHQQVGYYGFPNGETLGRAFLYLANGGQRKLKWQLESIDRMIGSLQELSALGKELVVDDPLEDSV